MTATRQRPRTCVACRTEAPKRALVRIARTPDGRAVLDVTGRLPGRGAYLCLNLECLKRARRTGALSLALKAALSDECWAALERCIASYASERGPEERMRELRSLLGLSRRAGQILLGRDDVRSHDGRPLLILTAQDASGSVRAFAEGLAASSMERGGGHEHRVLPLGGEGLSAALGAGNVQIIALPARSGLADKIRALLGEGGDALEQQDTGLRTGEEAEQEQ